MQDKKFLLIEAISVKDLAAEMAKEVTKIYNNTKRLELEATIKDDLFITRLDVAEMFHITLPTVHAWANAGILKPYKIGNKTRFLKSEVKAAAIGGKKNV